MRYELLLDDVLRSIDTKVNPSQCKPTWRASLWDNTKIDSIPRCEELRQQMRPIKVVDSIPGALLWELNPATAGVYDLRSDTVYLRREWLASSGIYYRCLFHELTHATGASGRLGRIGIAGRLRVPVTGRYYEELVADIGSMMLQQDAGLHLNWLEHMWFLQQNLEKAAGNKDTLRSAGAEARVAVNYLLQRSI